MNTGAVLELYTYTCKMDIFDTDARHALSGVDYDLVILEHKRNNLNKQPGRL